MANNFVGGLKHHKYEIIIFLLLSLIPFYWLSKHPVGWGDTGLLAFFYNSEFLSNIYKYTWASHSLTGYSSGNVATMIPIVIIFNILSFFNIKLNIQQAFVFSLIMFLSMLFMYLFIIELFNYRKDKKLIGTIAAIFYIYNPLTMVNYWYTANFSKYLLPFISLVLYLFLMLLKRKNLTYILLFSLTISIFSVVFLNPAFVAPVIILLLLYFVYNSIIDLINKNTSKIKKNVTIIIILTILFILINAWFLLPLISFASNYYHMATIVENPWLTLIGSRSSMNLISLIKLIIFKTGSAIWLYKDPAWRFLYDTPYFVFLSISTLALVLLSLITNKKDKNILFFGLLLIVGFPLCIGLNPPFGFIYEFMFKNIPFSGAFRSPNKFIPILLVSYTVLFSVGVSTLHKWIKHNIKIKHFDIVTIVILLLLISGVYVFPMWTGSIVDTPITIRGNEISSFVEVPGYYGNISEYFNKDPVDYRVLSLPLRPSGYVGFKWKYGYDGPDFTWLLYQHDTISSLGNNYYSSAKILSEFKKNNFDNLKVITRLFGIKYIVLQNDVDIVHGNYGGKTLNSPKELEKMVDKNNVQYIKKFGQLELYRTQSKYFLPHIYTTSITHPVIVNGTMYNVYQVITYPDYNISRDIFFSFDQINEEQWQFLKNYNNSIFVGQKSYNVPAYNRSEKQFSWSTLLGNSIKTKYYPKWKSVIRTDGKETEDTLSFPSIKAAPYKFPSFSKTDWSAFNSTLVYIKTGNKPLKIDSILENGKSVERITGIWWETGWVGMGTKPVEFPVVIPPHQKAIIQLNHKAENLSIATIGLENLSKLRNMKENNRPLIIFKRVNPTKYIVNVENATKPFFLVFSESYNPGWKIYYMNKNTALGKVIAKYPDVNVEEAKNSWYKFTPQDVVYLLRKPAVNESYHFKANGYANAWYINPEKINKDGSGNFTLTIYFRPQSYFYLGLFISMITLILSISYLFYDWKRDKEDRWAKRLEKRFKR